MLRSNKVRWVGLGIVFVIFIVVSIYRYQQVNEPFENYSISEVDMHVGEPVTIEDVTYEFGTPMISEDADKFTYEIPTVITNDSQQPAGVDYENLIIYSKYLVQNGIALDEVINHPKNEDSTAVLDGVPPGEEDEVMLKFFLYKDWYVEKDTHVDMYYRHIRGDTVVKYKLPINH